MDTFNNTVNGVMDPLFENEFLISTLRLLLVLYGGLAAPKLPMSWAPYFANTYTRIAVMFMIVYVFNKDPAVAILVAVGYYLSIHYLLKKGLQITSLTGIVSSELANLVSGGTGPSIKPSVVINAEAKLMQDSVDASKKDFEITPEAVVSGPVSTGSNAGIPTIPSGNSADEPSMMAKNPENSVPSAFTPDFVHDLAVAPE